MNLFKKKSHKTNLFFGLICLSVLVMLVMTGCRGAETKQEAETKAVTETKAATETKADANAKAETETEADTKTEAETKSEADAKAETETEADAKTEAETKSKADTKDESETETETETESEEIQHVVGIDPGHQGSWVDMSEQEPDAPGSLNYKPKASAGTTGAFTNVPEYELNLDISLALREELEARGYRVVMTREDNDTAISNSERAIKAAEEGSEIYVRIHANGSDDSSINGALTMTPSESNPYVGALAADSYLLSECILNQYCESTGFANQGLQYHDDMTGINWSSIPVTILEMGFMTNEHDDTLMQDSEMQKKMVTGIANGIDQYFAAKDKTVSKDFNTASEVTNRSEESESPIKEISTKYLDTLEKEGQKWSISIETLKDHTVYDYQSDQVLQSASVIKVFIMGAVYDRMCYPSSPDRLIQANESYDGELRELLEKMITVSDNDAANTLVEMLGGGVFEVGAEVVNEFCQEYGYTATSLGRRFLEENPTGDNYTSAADCRKILADIYDGTCVGSEASGKMLDILKQQTLTYKIPAGLPDGFSSANKTGEMPEGYGLGCIENDIAIVFTEKGDYVLSVLANELNGTNDAAQQTITKISSFTADWFQSRT